MYQQKRAEVIQIYLNELRQATRITIKSASSDG